MQQEELAQLFSANMNLSHQAPPPYTPVAQPQEQVFPGQQVYQQEPEKTSQPITYISQHYTHTHHVVPIRHIPQEPVKTQVDPSELQAVFMRNDIDPSLLFPSQIDLFQNADDDQRLRLLELWRISPPQGSQGYPAGVDYNTSRQLYDWPPTSLAQEESMARLRYEQLQTERAQQEEIQAHQQQLNQSMDIGTESAAVQETRDLLISSGAEPYILSGYEMMANREYEKSVEAAANQLKESTKYNQATDPVYNSGGNIGLWEKHVGSTMDMENQYGAFAQARDRDCHPVYLDDEMMM